MSILFYASLGAACGRRRFIPSHEWRGIHAAIMVSPDQDNYSSRVLILPSGKHWERGLRGNAAKDKKSRII
jgi:hypothetical protein